MKVRPPWSHRMCDLCVLEDGWPMNSSRTDRLTISRNLIGSNNTREVGANKR
jgi:hypothetical protein